MAGFDEYIKGKQDEQAEKEASTTTEETPESTEQEVTTEETTEQTPEVTTETTTEETPETPEQTEAQTEEFNEQLNTFFETTGKTKEDFKEAFNLSGKYSELEKTNSEVTQELDTLRNQNTELKKGLDPLSHFSSEEAYVAEQLRKKYPTMDPVAIQKAITKDLSEMSDFDVLALQDVIKRPGITGGETMAKKLLADDFGIDLSEPQEQWDEMAKNKLERAAYDARQELGKFQKEVELPAIKSEEDLKAEGAKLVEDLKEAWEPAIPGLINFDKISIPGPEGSQEFEFEVPQSFKDGLGDFFEDMIVGGELEPDKDTVRFMLEQRNKEFIYQNLGKIREAIEADVQSRLAKQTDEELNNETPPNSTVKPDGDKEMSGTEAHLGLQKGRIHPNITP